VLSLSPRSRRVIEFLLADGLPELSFSEVLVLALQLVKDQVYYNLGISFEVLPLFVHSE
jgi:hypothetical protein